MLPQDPDFATPKNRQTIECRSVRDRPLRQADPFWGCLRDL